MVNIRDALILSLWAIFLALLLRAALKGKLLQVGGRRIWLQFFLSILALTFWGEAAEAALDAHFGGLPVALYVKYSCLIGASLLYLHMLREAGTYPSARTGLDALGPISLTLGLMSFVVYAIFKPIPVSDLRFIVIGVRDGVVATFMIFGFLRPTLVMGKAERVPAMRFKQTAILLFFLSFTLSSVGSIMAAIMTILGVGDAPQAAQLLQPFIYPTVFFFVLMLIPYRWYSGLLHVQQLMTYIRLKRLEECLIQGSDIQPETYGFTGVWQHPELLELGIYRTVIAILDVAALPEVSQTQPERVAAVHECVQYHPEYAALVQALARLR